MARQGVRQGARQGARQVVRQDGGGDSKSGE